MRLHRITSVFLIASLLFAGCSKFASKPAGLKASANIPSTVTLDGKEIGQTPYESTNQKVGKYTVKLTPNGGSTASPYEVSLKLFPGYMTQIDWNFGTTQDENSGVVFEYEDAHDKNKAEIQLTASPDNVPVVIDGKNVGFTPLLVDTLSEGDHSISLAAPSYSEIVRTVKLVKGVRTLLTAKLAKQPLPSPTTAMEIDSSASASATPATDSAKKPTPTPKATAKPSPTLSASASASKTTTSTTSKPYVEILTTPTGWLRVRDTAAATGKELAKLDSGATVPYANASESGWLKVKYDGTSTGWVSSDYAKLFK